MKDLFKRYPYGWRESMRYHYYDFMWFFFRHWWCSGCNRFKSTIECRRQNTMYCDDKLNYVTCCAECFEEIEDYWQERWDEYNAGRL